METSINTTFNVHVKMQFESEYRRFFIERKSSFQDLITKIKTILGVNSDIVIKYKDEENEWITISSDQELDTGIILSNSVFRLHVCLLNNVSQSMKLESNCLPNSTTNISQSVSDCSNVPCDDTNENRPWRRKRCEKRGKKEYNNDCDREHWKNKKWNKGGRGEFYRKRREDRDAQKLKEKEDVESHSGSNDNDDDSLLNLEQIKKELASLKEELALLNEKKRTIHFEIKEIQLVIKGKRQEDVVNREEIIGFREKIQEKKGVVNNLKDQISTTKLRVQKLHDLATTKKE